MDRISTTHPDASKNTFPKTRTPYNLGVAHARRLSRKRLKKYIDELAKRQVRPNRQYILGLADEYNARLRHG